MWEEFGQLPLLSKARARKCDAAQCPACSSMQQLALLLVACLHKFKMVQKGQGRRAGWLCLKLLQGVAQGGDCARGKHTQVQGHILLERSAWSECMHTA